MTTSIGIKRVRWLPASEGELPIPEALGDAEPPSPFPLGGGTPLAGDLCRKLLKGATFLSEDEYNKRLAKVTASLRSPSYDLRTFHDDMLACFPELRLYLGAAQAEGSMSTASTSGISLTDEYKRTIGALFAVYWLVRLDLPSVSGSNGLDGQRGFSFGVDDMWRPPSVDDVAQGLKAEGLLAKSDGYSTASGGHSSESDGEDYVAELDKKRLTFYQSVDWTKLHQLMLDSGVLKPTAPAQSSVEVDHERCSALLALTACHDIMKVRELLPTVLPEHAPYHTFEAGSMINDHDAALAYVLEKDPEAIPCYNALPPEQRRSVLFTQAQLGFNHGWLVQAEAPPGALFSKMKSVVEQSETSNADIAFYFVHWLTDLAGALPTPLNGTEKFAAKFPHAVLGSFIRSFSCVQRLAKRTPTELMQEFLIEWWPTHLNANHPTGPTAIAEMRLVVQAQTANDQMAIYNAFKLLSPADKATLGLGGLVPRSQNGAGGELVHTSCSP